MNSLSFEEIYSVLKWLSEFDLRAIRRLSTKWKAIVDRADKNLLPNVGPYYFSDQISNTKQLFQTHSLVAMHGVVKYMCKRGQFISVLNLSKNIPPLLTSNKIDIIFDIAFVFIAATAAKGHFSMVVYMLRCARKILNKDRYVQQLCAAAQSCIMYLPNLKTHNGLTVRIGGQPYGADILYADRYYTPDAIEIIEMFIEYANNTIKENPDVPDKIHDITMQIYELYNNAKEAKKEKFALLLSTKFSYYVPPEEDDITCFYEFMAESDETEPSKGVKKIMESFSAVIGLQIDNEEDLKLKDHVTGLTLRIGRYATMPKILIYHAHKCINYVVLSLTLANNNRHADVLSMLSLLHESDQQTCSLIFSESVIIAYCAYCSRRKFDKAKYLLKLYPEINITTEMKMGIRPIKFTIMSLFRSKNKYTISEIYEVADMFECQNRPIDWMKTSEFYLYLTHYAITACNIPVLEYAIEKIFGNDPSAINMPLDDIDFLMMLACERGYLEVLKLFVKAFINVNNNPIIVTMIGLRTYITHCVDKHNHLGINFIATVYKDTFKDEYREFISDTTQYIIGQKNKRYIAHVLAEHLKGTEEADMILDMLKAAT